MYMDFLSVLLVLLLMVIVGITTKLIKVDKKVKRFNKAGIYEASDMVYSEGMQGDRKGGIISDKRISTSHIKSLIGMT